MKFIRRFYAFIIILGLFMFSAFAAYYSTPMLPDVEIEFKANVPEDIYKTKPPVLQDRNVLINI